MDPNQPADQFRSLDQVRSQSVEAPRLTAILMGLFAVLAVAITAAGLGGVIAFSVNQRTQEFGVRMALGASRVSLLRMVLGQAVMLVGIGRRDWGCARRPAPCVAVPGARSRWCWRGHVDARHGP